MVQLKVVEENAVGEARDESEEEIEEKIEEPQPIPLASLNISQCIDLMQKIFPTIDLRQIIEEKGITGQVLYEITSLDHLQELELDSKLKNIHKRALLSALERFRKEGVIL